jgi:hypothetical protein
MFFIPITKVDQGCRSYDEQFISDDKETGRLRRSVVDKGEPHFEHVLYFDALGNQRTRTLSLPLTMRLYSALLAQAFLAE